MSEVERPEIEATQTTQEVQPQGLADVLREGLTSVESADSEQKQIQPSVEPTEERVEEPTDGEQVEEQVPATEDGEQPLFGKLTIREGEQLKFKSKEEFDAFVKSNELLNNNFVPKSEWTRKTQEFSNKEKELTQEVEKIKNFWTENVPEGLPKVQPNQDTLESFKTIWQAYNSGNPQYKQNLETLLSQADQVLYGQHGNRPQVDPKIQQLEKELGEVKSTFQSWQEKQAQDYVENWVAGMQKQGNPVTNEIRAMMATFTERGVDPVSGEPITLDRAYKLAVGALGLSEKQATKKVFADARRVKSSTSRPVNSASSANAEPVARNIGEILQQGARSL